MKVTWMPVFEGFSSAGGLDAFFSLPASSLNSFLFTLTCVVCDWGALESWASGSLPSPCSAVRSVSATTLDAIGWGFSILLLWIWFLVALAARCSWACGQTRCGNWSQSSIPWRWRCGWGGGGSIRGRWKGAMMPYRKAPCKLKYMNACGWVILYIRCLSTAPAHQSFSANLTQTLTNVKRTKAAKTIICHVTGRSLRRAWRNSLIPSPMCFRGSVMKVTMVTEIA